MTWNIRGNKQETFSTQGREYTGTDIFGPFGNCTCLLAFVFSASQLFGFLCLPPLVQDAPDGPDLGRGRRLGLRCPLPPPAPLLAGGLQSPAQLPRARLRHALEALGHEGAVDGGADHEGGGAGVVVGDALGIKSVCKQEFFKSEGFPLLWEPV